MKSALTHVLFLLFAIGVFGDADKAETVSVIEGDSVTLHNGVTEIQRDDEIEWKLNGKSIAIISGDSSITGVAYRDGMKLDKQTGDLKITNIRTTDSGQYKLEITRARGSPPVQTFSVRVVSDEKKPSVLLGEYVTLPTGVTDTKMYDVIQWKFGVKYTIAEVNMKTGNVSYYDDVPDVKFRDRLQLDYWTGSLTITDTRPEHAGVYEVDLINSRKYTIHKTFSVTVKGEIQSVSVKEGEPITLKTDTVLQTHDTALWMFGDTFMVSIQKSLKMINVPDDRFRDRLKPDDQTGSLTITNTRNTDSGDYEVKISSSKQIIHKKFNVTVTVPGLSTGAKAPIVVGVLLVCVSAAAAAAAAALVIYYRHRISELKARIDTLRAFEGETFTLNPDVEVLKDDKLQWMFRGSCIAERKSAADRFTVHDDVLDGRFKGRLELNPRTGSLTITNTRTTHTGIYELLITKSGKISIKRFSVTVFLQIKQEIKSKKEGEPVTLETDVTGIQEDELIQWKFGLDTLLAVIKGKDKIILPSAAKIFKDRLELDDQTGSLTIKEIRPTDAGIYMLDKTGGGNSTTKLFKVEVSDPTNNTNIPEENEPFVP